MTNELQGSTILFFAGLRFTHSPTRAGDPKQNRHQTLNSCSSCVTAGLPPGPKFWVWREPWLFSAPLPTLQCILQAPLPQPASTRKGKGPCPAVISLGQRLLSSGVRLVPSRQFLPHTPQQRDMWSVSAQHFKKRQVPSCQDSCLISRILTDPGASSPRIPVLTRLS